MEQCVIDIPLQSALRHSPGQYQALCVYKRKFANQADGVFTTAVARLMKTFETPQNTPDNLHVLTAINAKYIGSEGLPGEVSDPEDINCIGNAAGQLLDDRQDVIIQIAADNPTDRAYALRVCHAVLNLICTLDVELLGETQLGGAEPFGFYHGSNSGMDMDSMSEAAKITSAGLQGCSWLFFQQYNQDIDKFFALTHEQQFNKIGASFAEIEKNDASFEAKLDAHKNVMRESGPPQMIRRGFAYRKDGNEGVCFLAVAKSTDSFTASLTKMIAGGDQLFSYIDAVAGGIYFVPSSAEFLDPEALSLDLQTEAPAAYSLLRHRTVNNRAAQPYPMATYPVGRSFLKYIKEIRSLRAFPGENGSQMIDANVYLLLDSVHKYLARENLSDNSVPPEGAFDESSYLTLKAYLDEAIDQANEFNSRSGKYKTLS